MKKNFKKLLFLSFVFFVVFFLKPSNVSAVYNCFYMLPYSGWDYNADKPLEFDEKKVDLTKYIYSDYLNNYYNNVHYNNNMYNNYLSLSGLLNLSLYPTSTLEDYNEKGNLNYPFSFHFFQAYPDPYANDNMKVGFPVTIKSIDSMPDYSLRDYLKKLKKETKCPQYLKVKFVFNGQPENPNPNNLQDYLADIEMTEATKSDYSSFLKSSNYTKLMKYSLNEEYEGDSIIPHFSYDLYDDNPIEIVLSNFYFPDSTIGATKEEGKKRIEENQEAAKIFNDIYVKKWDAKIGNLFENYKKSCGDNWDDLLSVSKHANALEAEGIDSYDELKVGLQYLYGVGKGTFSKDQVDKDYEISNECLNARSELIDVYVKAFMPFWQSIRNINVYFGLSFRYRIDNAAHEAQSFSNKTPQIKFDDDDMDTNPDAFHNFFIRNMLRYYPDFYQSSSDMWSLMVIGGGVNKKDDTQSTEAVESKKYNAELKYCTDVKNAIAENPCYLHCSSFINHSDLTEMDDATERYKVFTDCLNHDHSSCTSSYNGCNQLSDKDNRENCMASVLPVDYKNLRKTVDENLDKCISNANDKLNTILDSNIYKFAWHDVVGIRWNSIVYEGDCADVQIFRSIWLIITIGAPFLVIVLGSIDFFKNVVTTEPEAKKKNKKRFIRRIIALVVLILTPFIIKLIINSLASSDSSASNIKLMQCIVNGK